MNEIKTSIVTGGYGSIGKSIAEGLAKKGYKVVIVGRNKSKLQEAAKDIVKKTGNENIDYFAVDLSRKKEIDIYYL